MVCIDYPRPDLENTVNYLEAAALSSSFRASSRPNKPLEVVIAGAGENSYSSNMNTFADQQFPVICFGCIGGLEMGPGVVFFLMAI